MAGDMHCDDDGGVDEATIGIYNEFAKLTEGLFNQDTYNQAIGQDGTNGLVFRLSGYNGGMNQMPGGNLQLAVFISDGTAITVDGGSNPPPKWDGTDLWTLDSLSIVNGQLDAGVLTSPLYYDFNVYITNGVIVAKSSDNESNLAFPFRLVPSANNNPGGELGNITLLLQGAVLTANISQAGSGYQLTNGIIAGRYPTNLLTQTLGTFLDPQGGPGAHLCPGSPTFTNIQPQICPRGRHLRQPRCHGRGSALRRAVSCHRLHCLSGPDGPGVRSSTGPRFLRRRVDRLSLTSPDIAPGSIIPNRSVEERDSQSTFFPSRASAICFVAAIGA